jgi:hypothetical protein
MDEYLPKLALGVDHLIGSYVEIESLNDTKKFKIESIHPINFCVLVTDDGNETRKIRLPQLLKLYAVYEVKYNKNLGLKTMAFNLLTKKRKWDDEKTSCKDNLKKITKRKGYLTRMKNNHDKLEAEKGPQLASNEDTHTIASLQNQWETVAQNEVEAKTKLEQLESEKCLLFEGSGTICRCFEELFEFKIDTSTLNKWVREDAIQTSKLGRKQAIFPEVEKAILECVLYNDKMGWPMGRDEIIELTWDMVHKDPKIKAKLGKDGPTKTWYAGWFERMKIVNEDIVIVSERATDLQCARWFNSRNLNWWFDTMKRIGLKYKFARLPTAEEEGEMTWLNPERVIVTDETCVSGGQTRKARGPSRKVVTINNRVEGGSNKRRTANSDRQTDDHVSLKVGHNLVGEPTFPVWILPAKVSIKAETRRLVEMAVPKYPNLAKINGQEYKKAIIAIAPSGGITVENIEAVATEMITSMFPDVANEDGKRVLWATDWHGSRFSLPFLHKMRNMGVVLVGWLPNTTSKMQSPDVELFGPFKSIRDKMERIYKRDNKGQKVCILFYITS